MYVGVLRTTVSLLLDGGFHLYLFKLNLSVNLHIVTVI